MNAPPPAPILTARLEFPDPRKAPRSGPLNGLVAIGGDLSVARLLLAYRSGIFPWSVAPVTWWSPDPRAIIEIGKMHLSQSLTRTLRKGIFRTTMDQAFRTVMERCAESRPDRPDTWISPEFIDAYTRLHEAGHAHSIECWLGEALTGGIYGVSIGGFFAAESMFHRASDASKVALHALMEHVQARGFQLFDVQVINPTTQRLGAITIPRDEYLRRLEQAIACPAHF